MTGHRRRGEEEEPSAGAIHHQFHHRLHFQLYSMATINLLTESDRGKPATI
jgi:hypothetical protein